MFDDWWSVHDINQHPSENILGLDESCSAYKIQNPHLHPGRTYKSPI